MPSNLSLPESWPPTQVRLNAAAKEPRPLLDDIDENPLTYFLAPADMDCDGVDMDEDAIFFDAGIEDASQPREAVRSVSPSSLEGLRKPDNRAMSPESDSDVPTTDDDDDDDAEEDAFSRFFSRGSVFPLDGPHLRPGSASLHPSPLSSSPVMGGRRGRSSARAPRWQPRRSLSTLSRPNRLWREPSPDVWSIEEETLEELMSEAGSEPCADTTASRTKKKVRFVLPEEYSSVVITSPTSP